MKRLQAVVISAFLIVSLFIGCDADSIMNTAGAMGEFGRYNLGYAGDVAIQNAVKEVDGFSGLFGNCVSYPDNLLVRYNVVRNPLLGFVTATKTDSGNQVFDSEVGFRIITVPKPTYTLLGHLVFEDEVVFDGKSNIVGNLDSVIDSILKAKEVFSSDRTLHEVLDRKFNGRTMERPCCRNLYDAMTASEVYVKNILPLLSTGFFSYKESDLDELKGVVLPIPVQAADFSLLYPYMKDFIKEHHSDLSRIVEEVDSETYNPGPIEPEEAESNKVGRYLETFLEDIGKKTEGREYQTLGDKMTICLALRILEDADGILDKYSGLTSDVSFSFKWVLADCGDEVADIMRCLEVVAYIYGVKTNLSDLIIEVID